MTLPEAVGREVESALRRAGRRRSMGERIESATAVGGGCINHGARVQTETGQSLFLKWNPGAPPEMFEREAQGLNALRTVGPLRVPEPLAWGDGERGEQAWLLLEYIEPGPSRLVADARLGRGLAMMHERSAPAQFGWAHDNWIGSLPQPNLPSDSWGAFWRDQRLGPQLALARQQDHLRSTLFDRILSATPTALADVTRPDMLHGDLWSGNAFTATDGSPVVIDPAVYAGHGEVDLAMSELFGGFGPDFYSEYALIREVPPAYRAYRRALYQLYYLMVHVNLFGASYVAASRDAAARVLAEVT